MADDFSQQLKGASALQVDVAHLDQIKTYLESVAKAVEETLIPNLDKVDQTFSYGRGESGSSALGSSQIENAGTLKQRHDQSYNAVKSSIENMVKAYRDMAQTVGKFATEYKTVEERNHAGISALKWKA
jgi:uncharacterized protein YukE